MAAMALVPGLTLPTAACGETPPRQAPVGIDKPRPGVVPAEGEGRAVSNLPYARGQTFRTLDEYLAHLERQGAIDLPYWRQIAPGLYERVTTRMPRRAPERATRAELMERFGFTR